MPVLDARGMDVVSSARGSEGCGYECVTDEDAGVGGVGDGGA